MSHATFLSAVHHLAPIMMGIAHASYSTYFVNNADKFPATAENGALYGQRATALYGLAAASVAIQVMAILTYLKNAVKQVTGDLKYQGDDGKKAQSYMTSLKVYTGLLLLFFATTLTLGALNIYVHDNFSDIDITVKSNGTIGGVYGDTVTILTYSSLSLGGVALLWYLANAMFFAPKNPIVAVEKSNM